MTIYPADGTKCKCTFQSF